MRPDYNPRSSVGVLQIPAHIVLIIALIISFGLQYTHQTFCREYLELSVAGLLRGYVWQLVTFQFLHAGIMHLLSNLIGIWFFGRFIEERLGKAHFWKLYLLSGVAGGVLQSGLMWVSPHFGTSVVGASAGIFGLVAAFAMLEPDATILAYFFIPLRAFFALSRTRRYDFLSYFPMPVGLRMGRIWAELFSHWLMCVGVSIFRVPC